MDTCCHFPKVIQFLPRPKNNCRVFWICRLESNLPFPVPTSLFPVPSSLFPLPSFLFPVPSFLFPRPSSLFPVPCSLFPLPSSLTPVPSSLFPLPSYAKRFHGEVAVHAGDDDVAVGGAKGAVDHEEVAVGDARADHRIALDAHEVRGGGSLHQQLVEVERWFEILLGGRWKPRYHRS